VVLDGGVKEYTQEVQQAEHDMRSTPYFQGVKSSWHDMMKWMEITRISRRKYLSEGRNTFTSATLLNQYPRLRDMPEAMSKF
jgi:hypothetical protein